MLKALYKANLYVNLKKYVFYTTEVDFLGYIVSLIGIKIEPARVIVITN